MAYDEIIRKWLEMQGHLRRIADPIGDTLRRFDLHQAQNSVGILHEPSSALDVARQATKSSDYRRNLTALSNSARDAHQKFESVTNTARLLAGPMDEARHALLALGRLEEMSGSLAALTALGNKFRLPERNEFAQLATQFDSDADVGRVAYLRCCSGDQKSSRVCIRHGFKSKIWRCPRKASRQFRPSARG